MTSTLLGLPLVDPGISVYPLPPRTDSVPKPAEPTAPFLRWAGGKRWLLPRLPELLGGFKINNYHEPFLGGGALFLGLRIAGHAHLADLNQELIETYQLVRDEHERIGKLLSELENTSEQYYAIRGSKSPDPVRRAANFIYLNHTSFNGIYRVNLKGEYNVPFGNRTNASLPSAELLTAASKKLANATLSVSDFSAVSTTVGAGDLVFLDPPYTVAHNNNGFIKYNQRLFSFEDQTRLSGVIDDIRSRGAYYVLTNAAHKSIATLFEKGDRRLELSRGNSIGGLKATRGSANEYFFTNIPEKESADAVR